MLGNVIRFIPADAKHSAARIRVELSTGKKQNVPLERCSPSVVDHVMSGGVLPLEIECENVEGLIKDVRLSGEEFAANIPAPPPPGNLPAEDRLVPAEGFHNPYSFVPFVKRPTAKSGPFGDEPAAPLDRMHPDCWSGRLTVRWTAVTPVLIPDMTRATISNDHRTVPIRVDHKGCPYLPASTIKGVVRSALEAVTASRFGVADEAMSPQRVGYRHTTAEAIKKAVRLELHEGTVKARVMSVARLPFDVARTAEHGDQLYATLRDGIAGPIVEQLFADNSEGRTQGWVMRTGESISTKRHERFLYAPAATPLPLAAGVEDAWKDLIANAIASSGKTSPGKEWPAHLQPNSTRAAWVEGLLAWAVVENNKQVTKLLPSMISRDLHPKTPAQLMPSEYRPAQDSDHLSFTDRLFGWVGTGRAQGVRQLRGRVRFASSAGSQSVKLFDDPVALQILSSPKIQQGRFYLGRGDAKGVVRPVAGKPTRAEAGYQDKNALRGFKVYPHHRRRTGDSVARYWDPKATALETDWKRPLPTEGSNRDDQHRSISGWVAPGTEFVFDVCVDSLTDIELGGLLYLLDASNESSRVLRVGGGKPLGFGSVTSHVTGGVVESRDEVVARWSSWAKADAPSSFDVVRARALAAFQSAMGEAFGADAAQVVAFERSSEGIDDRPVHYPRKTRRPDRDGKSYEWFVENDRVGAAGMPNAYPLPDLASPDDVAGLPYFRHQ